MTKRLLRATIYDPKAPGDQPAHGYIEARPTLRRHIEGGDPDDFIVTTARFTSHLGAALDYTDNDGDDQTAEATDGVAWFWLDVTDEGPYTDLWAWTFRERTAGGVRRCIQIPTGVGIYEYGDATDLDPDDFSPNPEPTPGWTAALAAETEAREDADTALAAAIAAVEAGDVDSVAGLTGTVTASDLKTALALPTNTASDLTALDGRLDTIEGTYATDAELASEATTRGNADTALDGRLDTAEAALAGRLSDATLSATYVRGQAVSTDDSFDLPTPSGVGLEFVIVGDALDDIRMDGASL